MNMYPQNMRHKVKDEPLNHYTVEVDDSAIQSAILFRGIYDKVKIDERELLN
jgi:hypothetical protein